MIDSKNLYIYITNYALWFKLFLFSPPIQVFLVYLSSVYLHFLYLD